MDVLMPDGTTITGVPEGTTQTELLARYGKYTAAKAPAPEQGLPSVAPVAQAAAPIAPPRPAGPVVPTDVMGNVIGEGVEPAGIASLAPAVPAAPALAAPPKPPSEFAPGEEFIKGGAGAFNVALPSMWEQAGVMKDVGVLGTVQKRLELFGKIDKGEVKDFDELRGLDLTTSQARSYLGATPEQRDMMKARLAKEVGQRTDFVKAAITTLAQYQEEMKKYKGRTTDLTDVEGAADFANWLAYNVGSGAVQLAPIMIAAVTTGGPGVLALGTTMGVSEAVGNRMQFLEEKIKDLPDDKKAEAVIDYVTKTGDTSLAVGIISGALDNLLGPAATLAKRGLSQVVKGETRAKALKEGLKEIPKQAGEEFITGGAQEAAQIAGAVREKEQSEFWTVENLKKILNSAAAEAAGAVGGGGMSTAARVYGAKPEEKGITELLKELDTLGKETAEKQKVKPEAEAPVEPTTPGGPPPGPAAPSTDLVKQTIPESEAQDYEAMLAEFETQLEGKPAEAVAKPAEEPAPKEPEVSQVTPESKTEDVLQAAEATKAEPDQSPELQAAREDLSKASKGISAAKQMKRNGELSQEQFDALQAQFDERKTRFDDLLEKEVGAKSPFYQEALDIGNKMIATQDTRAKGFGQGVISAARSGQLDEERMKFYRESLSDFEQRAPEAAGKSTIKETRGLSEFIATGNKGEIARYEYLKKHPEYRNILAKTDLAMQAVTDEANQLGFKINDINPTSPKQLQEVHRKASVLAGAATRYMLEAERVAKKQKTASQEKLDKAAAGLEQDIQTALQPIAAPAPKPKPKTALDKASPLRNASYKKNPFLTFLADKGLYHEKGKPGSQMNEFNAGQQVMVSGYGPVFKRSGMLPDDLVVYAIQDGYLPQDATESDLVNLIALAISGKKVEPTYSEQGQEDMASKYAERAAEEADSYEERTDQTDAEWYGMSEEEYMKLMSEELADTNEQDFAAIDEAINELMETPASTMSERAAMEALGFTEEEIQYEEGRIAARPSKTAPAEKAPVPEKSEAAPELELQQQTAQELKAKQDEIDRLNKENERLSKQAEAKAKADAERGEFVLTGSNRPADEAAARGQQDIFGAMAEPVAEEAAPKEELFYGTPVETLAKRMSFSKDDVNSGLFSIANGKSIPKAFLTRASTEEFNKTVEEAYQEKLAAFEQDLEKQKAGEVQAAMNNLKEYSYNPVWVTKILKKLRSVGGAQARLAGTMMDGLQKMWENGEFINAAKRVEYFAKSAENRKRLSMVYTDESIYKEMRGAFPDKMVIGPERGKALLAEFQKLDKEATKITKEKKKEAVKPEMTEKEILARMKELTREEMKDPEENPARDKEQADLARQLKALKAAEAPKEEPVKETPVEEVAAEPELSKEYQLVLTESRDAYKEFAKAQEAYRAQTIGDDEFIAARKKYDVVMAKHDEAYEKERERMVADEVVGPEETAPFPRLTREPYTFEGEFTEKGEEEQAKLLEAPIEKLNKDQINTLEKHYGFERGTAEFIAAVRKDVLDFVVKGATAVNGKIRAIIRALVNGVLATSLIFNPQFVSNAYTVSVPQYDVSQRQVLEQIPNKVAGQMSEAAKRAYAVIYPALKAQLKANNKFFIVADKQTATTFIFNPDGSPFMYDKTLFGAGIGDFMKGDNNVVANRITPAGLFDLGMRDAQRSADEAYMYGDYDFGKVFVLDKAYMGRNGPYSQLVMHSVWLNEKDAKQRLAALEKPGADDSRYSFGCINVKKDLFRDLVTNHLQQMDGAKIFIVPENGSNVMDFVNGKATYSPDIIRQRVAPVTEEVKTEKQRAEQRAGAKIYAREEEGQNYYSIQQIKQNPYVTQDEIRGMQYKAYDELRQTEAFKKSQQRIKDAQEESSKRFDAVVEESVRLLKENPQFKNVLGDLSESSIYNIAMAYRDQAEKNVPAVKLSEHDALVAQNKLIEDFYKSKNIPEPRPFSNQANQDRDYYSDPKFKKWFKASKAVDKNGKPFVGFHTTDKSFGVFNVGEKIEGKAVNPNYTGKLGSWFTAPSLYDREYEEGNAENAVSFSEGKEGDNTMLVHLSIQNPMEYEGFEDLQDDRDSYPSVEEFKQALIDKGHDGVVVRNSMTDGNVDRDDWVAFYPTQIKSAIGNRGTFDAGNADINESIVRKLPPGRSPELSAAAQLVKDGQMTAAEYDELVNLYKPIRPYAEPLKPATKEQVYDALDSAKREKISPEIPDGTRVGLRLDIPAFNRKGVYVVSIHQKGTKSGPGKVMGYDSVARVTDATFGLGRATAALDIAAGAGKDALQTIEGSYEKISPSDAYAKAQEALNDPAWTQIGIDPTRHAYFYDRSTTQPVIAAEEIIQIGNMVLGKNVTYGEKQQFLYDVAPDEPNFGQKPTDWDYIPDAQELKKRNPSLKRRLDKLNRDRDAGKISDEKFIQEVDAALKYAEMINEEARVPPRVRGYRRIKEVLNRDVRKGVLEADAADLAEWFIDKNPALVDDLGVSVKSPSEAGVGGFYNNLSRIMVLIKGGGARGTIVHEILHHLERMMPTEMQRAIREAWGKQLLAAQKRAKKPAEKLYFAALIEAHYGNNDHDFIDVADGEMSVAYVKALSEMHFNNPGNKSALELAKTLLQNGSVDLDRYQFFNPSEFWAVNGTRIVEGRYDAVKGGVLARLKNWLRELFQKIKGVVGFDSDLSVLRALDSLSKADGTFVSTKMLADGFAYQNIKTNYKGGELPSANWAMKDSSLWDDFVHTWQDNYRDLKKVQEIITSKFGKINNLFNAYDKEILSSGRETERTDDFVRLELRPLIKEMLDNKVTNDELAKYLHNRYAPERNEIINEKNQSPSVRDQGSGISTTAAAKYMKELDAGRKKVLEKLAKKVDEIVRNTQDILVQEGQETQETIDEWRRTSPHYVPLNRDESELDFVIGRSGIANMSGLGTRGTFGKQALGSTKTVVNILENIMLQRGRAIHRGEAARVGKALYGLSIMNPNPDFWMPINPDAIKNKDKLLEEMIAMGYDPDFAEELANNLVAQPRTARLKKITLAADLLGPEREVRTVTYQVDRNYQMAKNVFPVRINGQDRYILFNPKSPEAQRLVGILKDMNAEQLSSFVGAASTLTRWFSSVNSQYNPAFGLVNLWNDVQAGLANLSTTPLADKKKEVFKNVLPALAGLGAAIRRNRSSDTRQAGRPVTILGAEVARADWGDLWERSRLAGGKTGYRGAMVKSKLRLDLFNPDFKKKITAEDEHLMESELRALERGSIMKKAVWFADLVSDFNDTLENAVRLSAFEVAVRPVNEGGKGLTDEEAAVIAKTLTINFNKHGARTKNIRGLYAFFNAGVQSTARLALTLAGPAGKKIITYGLMLGGFNALLMMAFGFDDDEPPEYVKNKGFVVPLGGGSYFLWNLPGGFRAIPNTGRTVMEGALIALGALHSNKGLAGKAMDAAMVLTDAVNPLGNGGGLQILAPTFLDPYVAITQNKDAFGRPIAKEDQALNPTAGWLRTRDNASEISKGISYFLNYITSGGEPYAKGFVSPTGDQLDFLFAQVVGGAGKEVQRLATTISNKVKGEETPAYQRPMVNRVYGELGTPAAISARFYDNITMLAEHRNIIEGRAKDDQDVDAYLNKHPQAQYAFAAEDMENEVSDINATIHLLKQQPQTAETKQSIKEMEEGKVKMMFEFNAIIRNPAKESQ